LALEAKRSDGGLIYICNPNNPPSSITSAREIRWLAENLPPETYLLVDEAYIHFAGLPDEDTAINLVRNGKKVIVLRTFSKIYGMAGLRVGFAVASPELITRMTPYRNNVISIIGVRAVLAALQLGSKLVEDRRARIAETRSNLIQWCRERKIKFIHPHANFMMIETGRDVGEVSAALIAKGVAPGRPFPPYNTMLRVTIGAHSDMVRFETALAEVLKL
jgi:histidinol-phosphate aminotransferase